MALGLLCILVITIAPTESDKSSIIGLTIAISLMMLFFFLVTCHFLFQYTVISEKGIKARTVWRTLRALKWEEVKEVRYERFYVSVQGGFTTGWYVFDDGVERKQANGLVGKYSHITVKASRRAKKIIETFWHEPIVEKVIEQ